MNKTKMIFLLIIFFISSCNTKKLEPKEKNFDISDFYTHKTIKETKETIKEKTDKKEKRLTFSVKDQKLKDFVVFFTNSFHKSMIIEEKYQNKVLNIDFIKATEKEIVSYIAKSLSINYFKDNNIYFLGEFKEEDSALLIKKVYRYSNEKTKELMQNFNSNNGKITVTNDNLVIYISNPSEVKRLSNLIDTINSKTTHQYVIMLYFVDLNYSTISEKGATLEIGGKLNAILNNSNLSNTGVFDLSSYIKYISKNSFGELSSTPLVLTYENSKSRISKGESLPVPKRFISAQGTVTTNYETVNIGEEIETEIIKINNNKVKLNLSYKNSSLISLINNEVPYIKNQEFTTSHILTLNKMSLLGEIINKRETFDNDFLYKKKENTNSKTQILCKILSL